MSDCEFTIIENGERAKWIREGECNLCGACCCRNVIGVNITAGIGNEKTNHETDWDKWEGYSEFESQGMWWWAKFDIRDEMMESGGCCRLVDGKCSIWMSEEFSAACRYFPVHPRDIEKFEECGFNFRKLDIEGKL